MRTGTIGATVVMPAAFVVLWSTGFIGARYGLPYAGPLTFLSLRYGFVAGLLLLASAVMRAPWPRRGTDVFHFAVAGILVHGVYLGGVFVGISLGVEAGVSAMIVGLQPLLTAALASVFLKERVTPVQWIGLGLGLLGIVLVLGGKIGHGPGSVLGTMACAIALVGITAGTLYQKKYCAEMDLRTGGVVQFSAAGLVTAPLALWFEDKPVEWTAGFLFALIWLVVVLSIGAVSMFYLLIKRGAASKVSSLFFLVPPCTVLIAWLLFGETLGGVALIGIVMTAVGVGLAAPSRQETTGREF